MYADDLLLFKPISCQQDLSTFQCDVNLISQWTLQNHLSLNCNKTKYMLISRGRPGSCSYFNSPIYVYNNQIERVHQYKYLGGLDMWWPHLEQACWKCLQQIAEVTGLHLQNFFPTLPPGLHFPHTQVSGVTHFGLCLYSMGPPPQEGPTTSWESPTACLLLELQQNPVSVTGFSPYQPQPPITDEPLAHIWNLFLLLKF